MKLSKIDKDILTILDSILVKNSVDIIMNKTKYKESEIKKSIGHLLKLELLKILVIPSNDKKEKWYFHTNKVKEFMLNDKIRLEAYLKSSGYVSSANRKLREFQKDPKKLSMKLKLGDKSKK